MDQIYVNFSNFVSTLSNINNKFKEHPDFVDMLEHVNYNQGLQYLTLLKKNILFSEQVIINYCNINDKIGGGEKYSFEFITTSPSNFRYLFQAHLILTHINTLNLNNINLVEIGCGYGGLCLALNYLADKYNITVNKYHLIDLPAISKLQQMYLDEHTLNFSTQFHSAFTYGNDINDSNLFLVSNYCFSEISRDNQQKYINTLFQKISHGFFAWNNIPVYNFGFDYLEEPEYPMTGPHNRYVYF